MKCPHCGKDIKEGLILSESARIMGRRSRRALTSEQARDMAMKMHKDKKAKEEGEQ